MGWIIEDNILLSPVALVDQSPGGADVHNLIGKDYFERPCDAGNPAAGPFGGSCQGAARLKIWPKAVAGR